MRRFVEDQGAVLVQELFQNFSALPGLDGQKATEAERISCLLYTSDAAETPYV